MKLEKGKIYHNKDFTIMFRVLNCEISEAAHAMNLEVDYDFTAEDKKYNEIRFSNKNVFMLSISECMTLKEFDGNIEEYSKEIIRNFMSNADLKKGALFDIPRSVVGARSVIGFDETTKIMQEYMK